MKTLTIKGRKPPPNTLYALIVSILLLLVHVKANFIKAPADLKPTPQKEIQLLFEEDKIKLIHHFGLKNNGEQLGSIEFVDIFIKSKKNPHSQQIRFTPVSYKIGTDSIPFTLLSMVPKEKVNVTFEFVVLENENFLRNLPSGIYEYEVQLTYEGDKVPFFTANYLCYIDSSAIQQLNKDSRKQNLKRGCTIPLL